MESRSRHVVVVGAGPAGLMAADVMARGGLAVTVLEGMPTAGRKLLLAGRGGLNLTHSEPLTAVLGRYGPAESGQWLRPMIETFPPAALIELAHELGQDTFIGSSGRVFPKSMKASPLLRAWLTRLVSRGVEIRTRHRWMGLAADGAVLFEDASAMPGRIDADAVVLALGGASWPRLGADGSWQAIIADWGVQSVPLVASNCGALIPWSEHMAAKFAGTPLKRIALSLGGRAVRGEALITASGLEGGAVYALGPELRDHLRRNGRAIVQVDLRPDMSLAEIAAKLGRPRAKATISNWLRKSLGLAPAAIALLREGGGQGPRSAPQHPADATTFAARIKSLPLTVTGLADLARAISTAGGIRLDELDENLMLRRRPGVFAAGEMLDWDAPTGGYLLQATFATGHACGHGVLRYLQQQVAGTPASMVEG